MSARPGWGVDLSVPDPDPRLCPKCGVPVQAGHVHCKECFFRETARLQCLTERAWMERNYPGFRPRDLFPEDMDVSSTREEIIR